MEGNASEDVQYEGPIRVIIHFGNVRKLVLPKRTYKNYNFAYMRSLIAGKLSEANGWEQYPKLCLYYFNDKEHLIDVNCENAYRKFMTIRTKDWVLRVDKNLEETRASRLTDAPMIHSGVMCNGCRVSPIVGTRYRCIQCIDFDLCANCELIGKHSRHAMLRRCEPMNQYEYLEKDRHRICGDVHNDLQCNGCRKEPITGFVFKSIQCEKFHLCAACEKRDEYADHLVVRLPGWKFYPIPKK